MGSVPGWGRSPEGGHGDSFQYSWVFLVVQMMTLPEMQETQFRSLDQEDPLEKGMATHSSILAWKIPQKEKPGWLQSMGL